MEWDELNSGVADLQQDEDAPAESETDNPETDEDAQESSDSADDIPEDSEESNSEDTSLSKEDAETDITEEPETESEEGSSPSDVVTISGNAIILPEGYDFTSFASSTESEDAVVQAIKEQTTYLNCGFATVSFLLGVIIGSVLIYNFRLRRV